MGMFDNYIPDPPVNCPKCGNTLSSDRHDWSGKFGPCGGYVWRQGHASPVDHPVDPEIQLSPGALQQIRLPDEFWIDCLRPCTCGYSLSRQMRGTTVNGTWATIEFYPTPPSAVDAGDNVLLCPVCIDGWEADPGRSHYVCPKCKTIVRDPGWAPPASSS